MFGDSIDAIVSGISESRDHRITVVGDVAKICVGVTAIDWIPAGSTDSDRLNVLRCRPFAQSNSMTSPVAVPQKAETEFPILSIVRDVNV